MSQANVEFIEGLFTAAESMDKQALLEILPDVIAQVADPGIEWVEDPTRADATVHRGHDGVLASWRQWLDQWDEYETEVEDVIDCGDDVFVSAREQGRGLASGATVSSRLYVVVTVRSQKITRWREFYDEDAARVAAGLPTRQH
jgi:ketosteroid isomerase-like protein